MNLFEQSPSVLLRDASHENAGRSFAIEFFSFDYHISPTAPSDSFGLSPIFWEFVMEQVVEVRSCPIRVDGEDLCFDRLVGRFSGFLADGWLVELLNENTGRDRGSPGTHLRQLVSFVVVIPEYMRQLQSVKYTLQLSNLLAVSRHFCARARVFFLDLIYDQLGVTANRQTSDTERYGDTETVEESLVFSRIVGCWEMNLENIFESLAGGGDEHDACPRAFNHERTVEVHGPVLEFLRDGWRLDFCPLGDEVGECLRLDGRPWLELKLEGSELHCPLCDPSGGVVIVKDFTERGACDHRYGMRLEVVHQLPGCDQHSV